LIKKNEVPSQTRGGEREKPDFLREPPRPKKSVSVAAKPQTAHLTSADRKKGKTPLSLEKAASFAKRQLLK